MTPMPPDAARASATGEPGRPLISVIVPSYNRPQHMARLLDSILAQDFDDWECVIAEDMAPQREATTAVVAPYVARHPDRIRYHLNERNLGYDGSFRRLIALARGRFVFVMGDDDEVAPGAFRVVADAVRRHPDLGVVRGSHALFREVGGDLPDQVRRYYPVETRFAPGEAAMAATFRRLVAMSGIVLDRDIAHAHATDRWDGTLFYQHWVAAHVMVEKASVFLPPVLAYFRDGGIPLFGNADAERGLFTPGVQPPDTDLKMLDAQIRIAGAVEQERGVPLVRAFVRDLANYMYPSIRHQAHQPWRVFWRYYRDLGRMGFDRFAAFHFWFWLTALVGARRVDGVIRFVRQRLGYTPNLSRTARA